MSSSSHSSDHAAIEAIVLEIKQSADFSDTSAPAGLHGEGLATPMLKVPRALDPASPSNPTKYNHVLELQSAHEIRVHQRNYLRSNDTSDEELGAWDEKMHAAWERLSVAIYQTLKENMACEFCGEKPLTNRTHTTRLSVKFGLEEVFILMMEEDQFQPLEDYLEMLSPKLLAIEKRYKSRVFGEEYALSLPVTLESPSLERGHHSSPFRA